MRLQTEPGVSQDEEVRLKPAPPTSLLQDEPGAPQPNAVFDESGNFLTYSSLVGIKVVNLISNVVSRVLGEGGEGGISIEMHAVALKLLLALPTLRLQPIWIHHAPSPPPCPPSAGKVENERFLRIALHQGAARKSKVTVTLETLDKIPQRDPTIMAVAFKRQRIYLLSKREPQVCTQGP